MNIIVCIKQVPYLEQLKFDPNERRLVREGVESEINPFDKRAITKAVELRNQLGGEIVVVTMGPPQARQALVEALAMGADRAVHLLGREFAGADTLATARTLAQACRKLSFDLVFCGKYSTDAETAQVPPMLAELLDVPQVTGVTKLQVLNPHQLAATRELDDGFETLEFAMPAVLSASERLCKPIRCTPDDLDAAKVKPIQTWSAADLEIDPATVGAAGSPTWVEDIYAILPKRKQIYHRIEGNAEAVAQELVRELTTEGLFGEWKTVDHVQIHPRRQTSASASPDAFWVLAELIEGKIRSTTFELMGCSIQLAEKLNSHVAAVLIGNALDPHLKSLAAYGADRIYVADSPQLGEYSTEPYTTVLAEAIKKHKPFAVFVSSTANGRDLLPRVAAQLNVGLTGDCIGLEIDSEGRLVQLKPAFGGNIVAPILTKTRPVLATVRPGLLHPAEPDYARQAIVERLSVDQLIAPRTRIIGSEITTNEGIGLDNAEIIIGVGMGVGGPENLPLVHELASVLGASVGATRKVVDAGWLPRQMQIGVTGRSIAPRLYMALGVGGKFNHVVGIQRAGLVLSINSDPQAPIFEHSDYGVVGDCMEFVPALTSALKVAKARQPA